jgi:hypothetical protein
LLNSADQTDERVRKQLVSDITSFYRAAAFDKALQVVETEKNPDIAAVALRALDSSTAPKAREVLLAMLEAHSWREHMLETALQTLRAIDDPALTEPVRSALKKRQKELPTKTLSTGLDALAYLSRNEERRDETREFIASLVNHPREAIRVAAINALGTLSDSRSLPILQRFTGASKTKAETGAAERAVEAIRSGRKAPAEIGALRKEVADLQKQARELKKQVEALEKSKAQPEKPKE